MVKVLTRAGPHKSISLPITESNDSISMTDVSIGLLHFTFMNTNTDHCQEGVVYAVYK